MTVPELGIRDGGQVLQSRIGQCLVGLSLLHRVLVVAIKRGGVNNIERHLLGAIHHDALALGPHVLALHQHLGAKVDATIGVVGKFFLGLIIAGQRGIACIAVSNEGIAVLCAATMSQLTTQGETGANAFGVVRRDAHHHA